ncbi:murein hydrolase activator EnvC family protein [Woodsholea maritima]|uniref:murein hydrolase activator EnvC family protein n=1 Tax=Woodsholea maritima TaxID=240237 RepID=UPI000381F3A6|nr:peptidoglycan DD-metalloendopeptidase family protein [Woodsholea maritima]
MLSLYLALALQSAQPETAPPDRERIEALEREAEDNEAASLLRREEADRLAREINELQRRLIAAAEEARRLETSALTAAQRLSDLEEEEAVLLSQLAEERDSLAQVLAALQRINTSAPPALAVNPDDAAEAARAAGLLAYMAPQLEARARAVSDRLKTLEEVRQDIITQQARLAEAEAEAQAQHSDIRALIEERRTLEQGLRAEAEDLSRRAAAIGRQASNLRELLAQIEAFARLEPRLNPRLTRPAVEPPTGIPVPRLRPERPTEPVVIDTPIESLNGASLVAALPTNDPLAGFRFSDMRGRLRLPVAGQIITRAGQAGPDNVVRDGIWIEARAGSTVTAPFDGMIVFAQAFQNLDGVLMITTADDYTLILGGLSTLYVQEGRSVLAGEPLGALGDGSSTLPRLYFELRREGTSLDPRPWLRPEYR